MIQYESCIPSNNNGLNCSNYSNKCVITFILAIILTYYKFASRESEYLSLQNFRSKCKRVVSNVRKPKLGQMILQTFTSIKNISLNVNYLIIFLNSTVITIFNVITLTHYINFVLCTNKKTCTARLLVLSVVSNLFPRVLSFLI